MRDSQDLSSGFGSADWLRLLAVFALFCAATAILFAPLLPHLGSALIGPPEDNLQDFWNSWYAAAAPKPHGFFFTDLIRYPDGMKLTYHSFAYPQVFAVAALAKIAGTDMGTLLLLHNLTLLLSFPLAGLGAYLVVRRFTNSEAGALAGGFVFAFNPSHVAHAMHHAHVTSIEFIPFFVFAYLTALEKRSFAWLGAAIVFWALSALSSWYYLFYLGYFVVFHTLYVCARDRTLPGGWRLYGPLASAVGTVLLLSPLLVRMLAEHGNPAIYTNGANEYVADPVALFVFPPTHFLGGWTKYVYRHLSGNAWEAAVYLGLANLAAIALYRLRARRAKDPPFSYALWGMAVFLVIAAGDHLHVLGREIAFMPLPSALLSKLPFFADVRTPSRAIVMVYLFLSIAVGQAFAFFRKAPPNTLIRWAGGACAVLMVLDFYPAHLKTTPLSCPAGLSFLRGDADRDFGVLDLPGGYVESNYYMATQPCHGRPIAQGNVARQLYPTLADRLEMGDLDKQKQELRNAKIKYIVIHKPKRRLFHWPDKGADKASYAAAYAAAYDDGDVTVLRVY
jgi:hypothetical protein